MCTMNELDLKDRKILYELDLNARRTDSEIAKKVDVMFVIGGENSSNTQKLYEICQKFHYKNHTP